MNDEFLHIVLTRFNIPFEKYGKSPRYLHNKFNEMVMIDKKYLEYRVRLFERITLKSLSSQHNKNFFWIILLYDKTPQVIRDSLCKLCRDACIQIRIKYLNYQECMELNKTISTIIDELNNGYDYILTTRIDNDDMFHPLFTKLIHEYIKNMTWGGDVLISYPKGISYIEQKGLLLRYNYDENHFISLMTKYVPQKTKQVLAFNHTQIRKLSIPIDIIKTRHPIWLEYVHMNNYANDIIWKLDRIIWNYKEAIEIMSDFSLPLISIFSFYFKNLNYLILLPYKKVLAKIKATIINKCQL